MRACIVHFVLLSSRLFTTITVTAVSSWLRCVVTAFKLRICRYHSTYHWYISSA